MKQLTIFLMKQLSHFYFVEMNDWLWQVSVFHSFEFNDAMLLLSFACMWKCCEKYGSAASLPKFFLGVIFFRYSPEKRCWYKKVKHLSSKALLSRSAKGERVRMGICRKIRLSDWEETVGMYQHSDQWQVLWVIANSVLFWRRNDHCVFLRHNFE